jgi:hypothetical protein
MATKDDGDFRGEEHKKFLFLHLLKANPFAAKMTVVAKIVSHSNYPIHPVNCFFFDVWDRSRIHLRYFVGIGQNIRHATSKPPHTLSFRTDNRPRFARPGILFSMTVLTRCFHLVCSRPLFFLSAI